MATLSASHVWDYNFYVIEREEREGQGQKSIKKQKERKEMPIHFPNLR